MSNANLIAGVSGGRTSALMALKFVPKNTILCFQNTGREHPATLEFIRKLEDDLQRPIVRLEWRAPSRGERPGKATFEAVSHDKLSRNGEPFSDLLECLAAYRKKEKGLGPVAPWAMQRMCTAYMKIRTQIMYCKSLGWDEWTTYVGLRYDEPDRVARMRGRNEARDGDERAPLFDAKVSKGDVLAYWSKKPYDLEIPDHLGNCTGCFLKDEGDLARALLDPVTDAAWWTNIEASYAPMRRGRTSYAEVLEEAPYRMRIAEAVAEGREPLVELSHKRHTTLVKQEKNRLAGQRIGFSCSCETAERLGDEDVLNLSEN